MTSLVPKKTADKWRQQLEAINKSMLTAASTGNPIIFNQGGMVGGHIVSQNTSSVAEIRQSFSQMSTRTKKARIDWRWLTNKEMPLCDERMGGPRSRIYCEVFKSVPHTVHHGRGRKRWFEWSDDG